MDLERKLVLGLVVEIKMCLKKKGKLDLGKTGEEDDDDLE
jgi:hypothetical protein